LSRVKSFMRTRLGAVRPACSRLRIGVSPGHGRCEAEVIIASTEWPLRLKGLPLRTSAGRRFVEARSVNGKGTTTTCQTSQVTVGLFVLPGTPLDERRLDRGVERQVDRLQSA